MKSLRTLLLVICAFALYGCANDDFNSTEEINRLSSVDAMLSEFYCKIHRTTKSEDAFKIINIETRRYTTGEFVDTRATESPEEEREYEIHTVTLDVNGIKGYAILSDTPGIERVFYYTESGCLNDTSLIPPLKAIIEGTPEVAARLLLYNGEETRANHYAGIDVEPLVRFQWDQGWPYNFYATYCTCEKCSPHGNHMPAGCVPIALAQTIATLKIFRGTFYGNKNIDFDRLPSIADKYTTTPDLELTLGHFLQEIALNCQLRYRCDGSGTTLIPAALYLRDIGYRSDLISGDLDVDRYIRYLKMGLPHIMGGFSDEGMGHAWILDGIRDMGTYSEFHHNWGWGALFSSGWSDECMYRPSDYSPIGKFYGHDTQHIYIDK